MPPAKSAASRARGQRDVVLRVVVLHADEHVVVPLDDGCRLLDRRGVGTVGHRHPDQRVYPRLGLGDVRLPVVRELARRSRPRVEDGSASIGETRRVDIEAWELGIGHEVVGVQVDESGRHVLAGGVDHLVGVRLVQSNAHRGDLVAGDRNVGYAVKTLARINHRAVPNQQVPPHVRPPLEAIDHPMVKPRSLRKDETVIPK